MAGARKLQNLLDNVRARIRPTSDEKKLLEAVRQKITSRLAGVLPANVEIGLMGSTAKGTALRGNREIDIFLLFPESYKKGEMEKIGLAYAKKAMRGLSTEVSYAQHPYLKAHLEGIKIDIVPSYKIYNAQKLGSATDRSQLHAQWVNSRITDAMRDDVRLLKQFMKEIGIYGAQTRVEGFSGYLCELLVMNYGSFAKTIEAACAWKKPALDIGKHYPNLHKPAAMFPDAAMVCIDPVDAKRNVAAVVSHTSLSRMIIASRAFAAKPDIRFFFKEKAVHEGKALKRIVDERKTHCVALIMPSPDEVEDILWPQLRKTAHMLLARLNKAEFRVFGSYFWADKDRSLIMFEMVDDHMPSIRMCLGPQVWHAKDVESFIKTHKNALNLHVEHERVVAVERRLETKPEDVIKNAIKNADKAGIPAPFARALKKVQFTNAYGLLKDAKLSEVVSDYFSRRM